MADYTHTGLTLSVQHVPDYSIDTGPDGLPVKTELPGHVVIGTEVDGVFVPLLTRKAGGLLADIARAKDAAASSDTPTG